MAQYSQQESQDRTRSEPMWQMPIFLTPLLGREQEVASICARLRRSDVRLLTITGTGGVGKTSLSLQIVKVLRDDFADGVCFVALAPITDPNLVMAAIAHALEIKEVGDRPLLVLVQAYLRKKHLLLLLDNFEQVLAAGPVLIDLLGACPGLKILVTSRAVLHLHGEYEFPVSPLAVPDLKHLPDIRTLTQYPSIALFLERARVLKPDFELTEANARAIAEICVRLDGLPLAIELAAARIKLLPPRALLARLEHRLQILTSAAQDVPARQRTLRNTIAWSYDLLNADEQRLFRLLSVFVGGCSLETLEQVYAAFDASSSVISVLDSATSLIDNSLLQQVERDAGEPRLMMLETLREYGLERLEHAGEMLNIKDIHASYFLALAEEAESSLSSAEQGIWIERLEKEHDNLRAALRWLLEQAEMTEGEQLHHARERALRLAAALWVFWDARGHWSEGRNFLERALAVSQGIVSSARAKALYAAADLAAMQTDDDRVEELSQESLALCRQFGDSRGMVESLRLLALVAWRKKGNFANARLLLEEALMLSRQGGDQERVAWMLFYLADILSIQGEYAKGCVLFEESIALHRQLNNKRGLAYVLMQQAFYLFISQDDRALLHTRLEESRAIWQELGDADGFARYCWLAGWIALRRGDRESARALSEESLRLFKEAGNQWFTAWTLSVVARVEVGEENYAAARTLYEGSLAITQVLGDTWLTAFCLEGLAGVAAAQGNPQWAARLWGAAECLRETIGAPIPPVERANYEQSIAATRASLGTASFAALWTEGRAMTPAQALAAQDRTTVSQPSTTTKITPTSPVSLTAREIEVLRLVTQGMTDTQVAEILVISPRTVNWYLTSIYSKLGVSSRSAATRRAIEQHLV